MTTPAEPKLEPGDIAPDFTAKTQTGDDIRLSSLRGRPVVLYFYPRDDTPGCTREACGFRDSWNQIQAKGAIVLGVSTDSVRSHERFSERYKLPFTLVSDEEKSIVSAYGVWGEKSFMGRKFQGTRRMTFLIGADGRIQKIWPKVKTANHSAEVLEALG